MRASWAEARRAKSPQERLIVSMRILTKPKNHQTALTGTGVAVFSRLVQEGEGVLPAPVARVLAIVLFWVFSAAHFHLPFLPGAGIL